MADKTPEADPQPEEAAGEQPKSSKTGVVIIVVAAVLGIVVGSFVVAPRVVARSAPAATEGSAVESPEAAGGGEAEEGSGKIYSLDNIIVNPAGSEGLRFLMASVAFEVHPEHAVEEMRQQEVRLRDVVISTLERQTMEMLTRPGARDSIKVKLADAVEPIVGSDVHVRVYLPRFVIQ